MQYRCKNFKIQELVSEKVYKARGDKAWELLDTRALITLDTLRELIGVPLTVNDWSWGGKSQYRGLRTANTPYFSTYSQHTFGRAFDVVSSEVDAEHMRQFIFDNQGLFPYIRAIELGTSWLHFDVRNARGEDEKIFTFYP